MSAPVDSEAQLQRIQRVREVLRCTRLILGLTVVLGISALYAATRTVSPAYTYAGIAAWFFGQVAVLALTLVGLRALRRRRFGTTTSSRIRGTSDALLYAAAGAGGSLALTMFASDVVAGPLALGVAVLGVVLLTGGLRGAWLYAFRE